MVAFSTPLVLPERGGDSGGSKDTQEQFAIQHLNARRFLPPNPCVAGEGGSLRWHKQRLAQWWIKREAGKMRPGRMDA